MSALTRNQTIARTFGTRAAELRCQAAESQALDAFLASADRAAHWRGMVSSGKRLIIAQALSRKGIAATDDEIAGWLARYEERYGV